MRAKSSPAKIVPPAPQPGDTIGIVAPASAVSRELLEAGCAKLRERGYKIFFFESILDQDLYFAGSHQRRAWELEQMFAKSFVRAIICARGGYGCNYLLPKINLDLVRANPKMLVGYSDVTTLLTYICDQTDMITFHGAMVTKDFAEAEELPVLSSYKKTAAANGEQVRTGTARGVLYGGCLSMLVASLGTPYEIDTAGTILFMEDIGAKPFQIDRMLMHLKLAGKVKDVRGIVFGEMVDCVQPGGQSYTLQEVIRRALSDVNVPIGFGIRSGHLSSYKQPGYILPIGLEAELQVSEQSVSITF